MSKMINKVQEQKNTENRQNKNSDEWYIGKFGDKLRTISVSNRNELVTQITTISKDRKYKVGEDTENGVWLFFDRAIKNKEHWDNIFIYSDQQTWHGGLYSINLSQYKDYAIERGYIDVAKLVDVYRKTVNQKVNVFIVQTAGYNKTYSRNGILAIYYVLMDCKRTDLCRCKN